MKKRFYVTLIAIALICAIAGASTMAYFTSSATSTGNAFAAGTLKIGRLNANNQPEEAFAALGFGNLAPGVTSAAQTTNLKNVGTLPFNVYRITADTFTYAPSTLSPDLAKLITIHVVLGGKAVYTGLLSDLVAANGGYFDPITQVAVGQDIPMSVTATLSPQAGNAYQSASVKCNFKVYAQQVEVPFNGQQNTWVNFGTAVNENGNSSSPTFSVKGKNEGDWVVFDYDWIPADKISEFYRISIKHHTGDDTTTIEEKRILLSFREGIISTDGIDTWDVLFNVGSDIIKIRKSALPSSWQGFEVKFEGAQNVAGPISNPWNIKFDKAIPYQYWSLNRIG